MSRRAKGPRLYLDPVEHVWVIRDGARKRRTGCRENERQRAEESLAAYIAEKYEPVCDSRPNRILVADVLKFYLATVAPAHKSAATTAYSVDRLLDWWGAKPLSEVKRSTCAEYVDHRKAQPIPQAKHGDALKKRVSAETARRELTVLRAAINAYHAENVLDAVPVVTLPEPSPPRHRWLTRAEVAGLLKAARSHPERPARTALIRFILTSLYTGTRSGAVRSLRWMTSTAGGWVDLEAGVMHRRGTEDRETNKRRPPLRIPVRLIGHMRRWHAIDAKGIEQPNGSRSTVTHIIHQAGGPLESQRRAWEWTRAKAGLGRDVVPHVLRHTCATWLMQGGADLWEAAGYLGMSPDMLWQVYGHHHPDFQRGLAEKIGRKR
ncbi:integrase [Pseudochelatococcus lubricantis]|uniref:Integrase n=1 Tax=Pseudochelatococcus lubricantis TaxID=1538102 RepID=A0ABX0UW39_9HYPH|nr:site-specific integrase [Pseudochelatococcus lubricantis]NIJ57158.1 integrase [Pseudochelatococcus lubricantis]